MFAVSRNKEAEMSEDTLTAFLRRVAADTVLKQELTELAARHGFDLSELSDTDLDAVTGGNIMKSRHDAAKNAISSMEREGTIECSS
jgi:hypothetical protein